MVDAKKLFSELHKIPIIGDLIIAFSIIVSLSALSSAGDYFGLRGEDKELLISVFITIGAIYFIVALFYRGYKYFKNR